MLLALFYTVFFRHSTLVSPLPEVLTRALLLLLRILLRGLVSDSRPLKCHDSTDNRTLAAAVARAVLPAA